MYLRKIESDYWELTPRGGTMQDVDMVARNHDEDKIIFGQATFSQNVKEIERKIKQLRSHFSEDAKLYFFGRKEKLEELGVSEKDGEIKFIPIEDIFRELIDDETSGTYKTIDWMIRGH